MVKKCRKSSEVILANGVQKFSFVDVMIYIIQIGASGGIIYPQIPIYEH